MFLLQIDIPLTEALKGFLNNAHSAFYDEFTRIDLCLGLLNLEKTLGHFCVVGDLHQVHALDLHASNCAPELQHLLQMFGNDGGVIKETDFIRVVRPVGELGAHTAENIVSLVPDEIVEVDNMVQRLNWLVYCVGDDG